MLPDAPQQQPSQPAGLPAVPMQPQSAQPAPTPVGGNTPAAQVAQQARQLVQQYGQDPFRLSGALQQLKSGYLTEQYHVTANTAEK